MDVRPGLRNACMVVALVLGAASGIATAKLPPLTPEQQKAADEKKAKAAADAEAQKKLLEASMDKLATRWRARAAEQGWKIQPAGSSNSTANVQLTPPQQSVGRLTEETKNLPIRSEKFGTATPSEDVKNPAEKGK